MPRRRFYAPPEAFTPGRLHVALSREETAHLTNVLRLREGAEVFVFDGEGHEFLCAVGPEAKRRAREATLRVLGLAEPPHKESPLRLTLAPAMLKGEKFDLVVQKATELGVTRIVPVEAERAEVRLPGSPEEPAAAKRVARWRRIAVEAAKQSGRARVPEVRAPIHLTTLLSEVAHDLDGADELRLIFSERDGRGLSETLGGAGDAPRRVTALVGPEGGWEDAEIEQATAAGWHAVTLGGRTLRAETAAVVAAALLQHLCGDLV
ncbi:MAG: 16S rRNA (uracil(1498)-N(3))-methyltransferase [Acidobacteria bacterium]|nr:16S rRNA (uracil(1498)-N(3))-methyltransferase [Acidobacteriota bacterium]